MTGVVPAALTDEALERELAHLHETRHDTFLHGSEDALQFHTVAHGGAGGGVPPTQPGPGHRRPPDPARLAGAVRPGLTVTSSAAGV